MRFGGMLLVGLLCACAGTSSSTSSSSSAGSSSSSGGILAMHGDACDAMRVCVDGEVCFQGTCRTPPGGNCATDPDCSNGKVCGSGICGAVDGVVCAGMPVLCNGVSGDGVIKGYEQCDDGNTRPGDGCSADGTVEAGYSCTGIPSACNHVCDDGNARAGDGCADGMVEAGWICAGTPSICRGVTGGGIAGRNQQCDDGNTRSRDGCSSAGTVEPGWTCRGFPSTCTVDGIAGLACVDDVCDGAVGDGLLNGSEECDDGNANAGDGCSPTGKVEGGFACFPPSPPFPSTCSRACEAEETGDDENTGTAIGCFSNTVVIGWGCHGSPFVCDGAKGDGVILGFELCDDRNANNGDGCSVDGLVESGFACHGVPSVCDHACVDGAGCVNGTVQPGFACTATECRALTGDGVVGAREECDDSNRISRDGCSAAGTVEPAYACAATGCSHVCDDGNSVAGDGCTGGMVDLGWSCFGSPLHCVGTVGDNQRRGGEQCDDGNLVSGDGCSSAGQVEPLPCTHSADCTADELCLNSVCSVGRDCLYSSECTTDTVCRHQRCRAVACTGDPDCSNGERCDAGHCRPS